MREHNGSDDAQGQMLAKLQCVIDRPTLVLSVVDTPFADPAHMIAV